MNPFEIVRRTPKSNCGQCGYPTCLAFAAAVAKSGEAFGKCPYLERSGLNVLPEKGPALEELSGQRDLALVEHLKEKISALDFPSIAAPLGATIGGGNNQTLSFLFLDQEVLLNRQGILLNGRTPDDPRDQILIYNYIHSQGGADPALDWIGLETLPNSISKVRTLATYCENRLAELFSPLPVNIIMTACQRLGGVAQPSPAATLGCIISVLPKIPQYIVYWEEEPDEGFPAKVKILFDRQVLNFLDLESLIFSAERLADRLAVLLA
ncbi:MAG: Fe-S cluster protein [Deltaproteobacteria bacterium RIFOXYD12_FULL_56_24]|nr:MAG: Fe-S cluster protein [Deltaproteobacteria bacterium RIFOXYD12_FULL_56_24]